jgi:hypothetical protein
VTRHFSTRSPAIRGCAIKSQFSSKFRDPVLLLGTFGRFPCGATGTNARQATESELGIFIAAHNAKRPRVRRSPETSALRRSRADLRRLAQSFFGHTTAASLNKVDPDHLVALFSGVSAGRSVVRCDAIRKHAPVHCLHRPCAGLSRKRDVRSLRFAERVYYDRRSAQYHNVLDAYPPRL